MLPSMRERGATVRISSVSDRRGDGNVALWMFDGLLGIAVALALALIITTNDGGTRPTDIIAYLFAAGVGAFLLLRRRMPRAMPVLSVLGVFAYYTRDYPPVGVAVPIVAALYSAAEAGLMLWSVGTSVIVFTISIFSG